MTDNSRWFWLITGSIFLLLLYLLSPILTPFVVGALLAYLGDPLADKLETYKISRTWSVVIVFFTIILILFVIFLLLVPAVEAQLSNLFRKLPTYVDIVMQYFKPFLQSYIGMDASTLEADKLKNLLGEHWQKTGGIIRSLLDTISHSTLVVIGWLTNLALIPVITFYLLRDWDILVAYIHDLLPRAKEPIISHLAKQSDEMLGAFLRGQLTVMTALGVIYSIGLGLVGVEFALLIGMLAGLLSFVPYLGLIIGIIIASIAMLLQTQALIDVLWVFLVFGIAQIIESVILTPLLVGDKIGLHPVTVIFAILAGGQLFGFFGILLALPVAAILAVLFRHFRTRYKDSPIYQQQQTNHE